MGRSFRQTSTRWSARPAPASAREWRGRGAALRGLQDPGEGDEVASVAIGLEELGGGRAVATREGGGEGFEPALRL
jgi:hypothetical protein